MSDTYNGSIPVSSADWVDLTATYPAMAGVQSWIQNMGSTPIMVAYTSSATKPTGGGVMVDGNGLWGGSAAHVWVKTLSGGGSVAVGLT